MYGDSKKIAEHLMAERKSKEAGSKIEQKPDDLLVELNPNDR